MTAGSGGSRSLGGQGGPGGRSAHRQTGERPGDPAEWLALAERAIRFAEHEGADQAEALVTVQDAALTRFANSEIHQNVAERNATVNLRFVIGKRIAVVSSGRTDDASLRRLAENAAAICRHVEPLDEFVSLPEPGPIRAASGAYAEATAAATPELRAAGARAVIGEADAAGVTAYGAYETSVDWTAVANTLGIRAAEERTSARLLTVMMGAAEGTGYAEVCAVDATTIDAAAIGREAAATARASRGPVVLEPGDYPVVLGEYAVVDLVDYVGYLGFSALAVEQGRSFYEPGKRVASDLVSIHDDAFDPEGMPTAFDYEGVGKERVTLLDRGVATGLVYDSHTAGIEGRRSTGHALPAPNTWGPFPMNQVMEPGTASREELIGGLERGLLVNRFWYTNPVHQKLVIMTGMTRDGTFLVEGGEIVGPVRNLRFTQSYLDALAGVEAVGRERKLIRGFLGPSLIPAVRIASFSFNGVSEE